MTGQPRQRPDVRQLFASQMSEAELDESIRDAAKLFRLRVFSIRQSKAGVVTSRGWPDLVIVGPGGVIWRELKTEHKEPTDDQIAWGDALTQAGQSWAVWKPSDWINRTIEAELRQLATTTGRTTP